MALTHHVRDGNCTEAHALYRGELLEGLFPEGVAQEFQEWLSAQRKALREQAARAAWECSGLEEERGDRTAAAVMARRARELDPDNEEGVRRLMGLLDRRGDRGGALRVYTEWQARLLEEFGVEPAPETRKLARRVQAARKGESHETPPVLSPIARPSPGSPQTASAVDGRVWKHWVIAAGVALLLMIILGLGAKLVSRASPNAFVLEPRSVAVLPLRPIGDPGLQAAADAIAEEITTALALDSAVTVRSATRAQDILREGGDIDRLGRRLGVAYVIDGGVQRGAGRLRATLRLLRTADAVAVWAGSYDLEDGELAVVAPRVAAEAAVAIRARLITTGASANSGAPRRP